MNRLLHVIRLRLLPAALTAAGVALVTAGLLTYTDPTIAGIPPSPSPAATPAPTPSPAATASPSLSVDPSTDPPASPSPLPDRVATRVAVPALRIDLPVIRQEDDGYPLCNVAMILEAEQLGQPGQGRATYLYAHARTGMFLPLLEGSRVRGGEAMIGMIVQVWTSDEQLFLYEIREVRPHQTTLDDALDADREQLWLQTSEGPRGTVPKLQVVAEHLSDGPAPDPAEAHPTSQPVECA